MAESIKDDFIVSRSVELDAYDSLGDFTKSEGFGLSGLDLDLLLVVVNAVVASLLSFRKGDPHLHRREKFADVTNKAAIKSKLPPGSVLFCEDAEAF